jgi:hypothetical protein
MSLGKNIYDAFKIVAKTYESIDKFMSYCQEQASEEGEFLLTTPKFLRYKSDNDNSGWFINSFILLFQRSKDRLLKNRWRKGPIYVMEINVNPYDLNECDEPMVSIAKFEYKDLSSWNEGISKAENWAFHDPLYKGVVEFEEEDNGNYRGVIDDGELSKQYWGLNKIVGIDVPLADITRENAYEIVFGGFRSLIDK